MPTGDTSGDAALAGLYRDLHAHPELSFAETRTAGIVAARMRAVGLEVTEGVGRTGVVGVLRNGDGPTALLRADMDGLPMREDTGLPYASTARGIDRDGADVPAAHSCGHDVHVTCLLGALAELAAERTAWRGTVLAVFQPAEEIGQGAQAMIDDGLYERFPVPAVVLGQHVAPLPAGTLAVRPGPAFAAADAVRIVLHGRGGHGSRPETTVDPVVMAAATVMRLQTIASREVSGTDTAIVTVGALRAGTKENIIPDDAELLLSVRTFDEGVRRRTLDAITRIVNAEAAASDAPRPPDIAPMHGFPAVVNDVDAVARTRPALEGVVGAERVFDPGPVTGSEDVGLLATAAGAPCVYWLLGGADPAAFARATSQEEVVAVVAELPSNHSPRYAPVIEPTITVGVQALVAAAHEWLPA
ncbi:hippurate hydrolase [Pseudonocardia thermophila]|jgi:amidohydrolase|uniref:Hippurate hydrolase n=1 Tax=Pseudonocardia thermophila TaxID=1848 RepID=A0A1M7AD82_PSETH|nr:amidohydrolase [Pseudonocardia thermophila]SHL40628.1 hippurate hydrolase [Pseudonocardia thermophila]